MDFSTFLAILIVIGIPVLLIALLVRAARPRRQGAAGESFVHRKLQALDPKRYFVLTNLMLPSGRGNRTTEIDHVVISQYGIFCIETKGVPGIVRGSADAEYWTHAGGFVTKKFYNPLRQNNSHIRALEALLRVTYPDVPIVPFVVFTQAKRLIVSGADCVGGVSDALRMIQGYARPVLSEYDITNIRGILMRSNITSAAARRTHIERIERIKAAKRE
jgi:hypothetical protein